MKGLFKYILLIVLIFSLAYAQEKSENFQDSSSTQQITPFPVGNSNSLFSLSDEEFNQGMITDPLQLIRGRVPGLAILKAGGDPTEAFELRLRGLNSINSSTYPLVVVDGFPEADYQVSTLKILRALRF